MPSRGDEITEQMIFNSVRKFWDSGALGRVPASGQQGRFVGGVAEGNSRRRKTAATSTGGRGIRDPA